jgi:hypothetical protein
MTTIQLPSIAAVAPLPRRGSRAAAAVETALIVLGLAAYAVVLPHEMIGDALQRYDNLVELLDTGRPPPGRYSMLGSLPAAALVWCADRLGGDRMTFVKLYNTAVVASAVLALYLLLRRRVDPSLVRRFLLVLIAASMLANHVIHSNGEPFTVAAVAVGLTAVAVRVRSTLGWALAALGAANIPATVAGLALVAAQRSWADRRLRYGLVPVLAVGIVVAESWLRNGDPRDSGYADDHGFATVMPYSGRPGFSYPLFFGVLALCLSFGKGLLFFAPGLILPVRRLMQRADPALWRLYLSWVAYLGGLVLVYGAWWSWYGGFTWGPRFLLFAAVPASLAVAVRLRDLTAPLWSRLLTLAVLAQSAWVGLCAAVWPEGGFPPACVADRYADEQLCHFTPEFSALWYPVVAGLPLSAKDLVMIAYLTVVVGCLAAPLVRSVAADAVRALRPAPRRLIRDWRW